MLEGRISRMGCIRSSVAIAIAMLVSSCSTDTGGSIPPDLTGKVKLDYENSLIVFPLDAYKISTDDFSRILLAREVILTTCMKKFGFNDDPKAAYSKAENRNFGVWNVDRVRQYGFGFAGEKSASSQAHDEAGAWGNARYKCLDSEKAALEQITPQDQFMNGGIANELSMRSLNLASQTDAWKKSKEEWASCISSGGLTPGQGPAEWSSQQALDLLIRTDQANPSSADVSEGIRIAMVEAECNQKTRLTQTLGDIQASYQLPLIRQNEAALAELKKEGAKYVSAADEVLREKQ